MPPTEVRFCQAQMQQTLYIKTIQPTLTLSMVKRYTRHEEIIESSIYNDRVFSVYINTKQLIFLSVFFQKKQKKTYGFTLKACYTTTHSRINI